MRSFTASPINAHGAEQSNSLKHRLCTLVVIIPIRYINRWEMLTDDFKCPFGIKCNHVFHNIVFV